MILYVASSNAGKLRDFRTAAAETEGFDIQPLPGLADIPAPPEDEDTFEGNARVKAAYYSRLAPGHWVIADDSGLEVDTLNGLPGVRSARYSADLGTAPTGRGLDADNNEALLLALNNSSERHGRYRCALALAMDGHVEAVGVGQLARPHQKKPPGEYGFGYDPLFFAPELNCSMAEASPEDRLRVSHRGRALRALLRQWRAC
ncbi:MAG: non-canonical purine NTP pyrophosphatase [Terriglobus sp.]